jgi:hypothetical protein
MVTVWSRIIVGLFLVHAVVGEVSTTPSLIYGQGSVSSSDLEISPILCVAPISIHCRARNPMAPLMGPIMNVH